MQAERLGVNPSWIEDVFLTVIGLKSRCAMIIDGSFTLIVANDKFLINLVSLNNTFTSSDLISLQAKYKAQDKLLIHLWEDVWASKRAQVISRFNSFLNLNLGIHGRKTTIQRLKLATAKSFINQYHLQGYVKAKYNFGLLAEEKLIAVASFSGATVMKSRGEGYLSAELVRFATKSGLTVVGGLSKLLKHFVIEMKVNDLMTYADRDWSIGHGYEKLGFIHSGETKSLGFFTNPNLIKRSVSHRLPSDLLIEFNECRGVNLDNFVKERGYHKVFNTGNLKYYLYP